ncbi:MAG: hypothetical protein R3301_18065 [Saprospiraceae bacterium]|nr:hypothetical protein [Saprospiraceae bacterium]
MLIFMLLAGVVQAQITYTRSFTKKLAGAQLSYHTPVESWLHVVPLRSDAFMDYDLVLQNDRNDYEVRYRIRRLNRKWRAVPQHVEVSRLVASIATNEPEAEIRMSFPDDAFVREAFNAESGLFARFKPKPAFSEKPFGTLVSLYGEGKAIVDVVVLYHDPGFDPIEHFRDLRFK